MTYAISLRNWKNGILRHIDVIPGDLETVRGILSRFVPDREVRAFGSRVSRTTKAFSDLDLAVMGDSAIPSSVLADMKESFSESSLPFKVDVVDWATTKNNFRRIIEKEYVIVQDGKLGSVSV
jgi:predicted nucleotidyltransferase